MTKQEIQQGYHDHYKINIDMRSHLPSDFTCDGWMQGAEWASKEIISKAAEWIYNNQPTIGDSMLEYVDKFRRAMEA